MRFLFLLFSLVPPVWAAQEAAANGGSPVSVVSHTWSRSRRAVAVPETPKTGPAAAMTRADKNFERTRRVNDPVGAPDPNEGTIDSRSAALEKNVQESRTHKPSPVDGYLYSVKVRNVGPSVIEVLFWEYQFTESAHPANVASRQFLCGVSIKPKKEKELEAFTVSGPSDVISAASLAGKTTNLYQQKILINRVEYADGSIWQRAGWDFAAMKSSIDRAIATAWGPETCRGL